MQNKKNSSSEIIFGQNNGWQKRIPLVSFANKIQSSWKYFLIIFCLSILSWAIFFMFCFPLVLNLLNNIKNSFAAEQVLCRYSKIKANQCPKKVPEKCFKRVPKKCQKKWPKKAIALKNFCIRTIFVSVFDGQASNHSVTVGCFQQIQWRQS